MYNKKYKKNIDAYFEIQKKIDITNYTSKMQFILSKNRLDLDTFDWLMKNYSQKPLAVGDLNNCLLLDAGP